MNSSHLNHFHCTEARYNGSLYNGALYNGALRRGKFFLQKEYSFAKECKEHAKINCKSKKQTYFLYFFCKKMIFIVLVDFSHF